MKRSKATTIKGLLRSRQGVSVSDLLRVDMMADKTSTAQLVQALVDESPDIDGLVVLTTTNKGYSLLRSTMPPLDTLLHLAQAQVAVCEDGLEGYGDPGLFDEERYGDD